MKRRHVIAGLVVLALAALLAAALVPSTGPTPVNVKKIDKGMTLAEVYAILGRPTEERWVPDDSDDSRATWWTVALWEPDDGYVIVVFCGGLVDQVTSGFAPSLWQQWARRVGLRS